MSVQTMTCTVTYQSRAHTTPDQAAARDDALVVTNNTFSSFLYCRDRLEPGPLPKRLPKGIWDAIRQEIDIEHARRDATAPNGTYTHPILWRLSLTYAFLRVEVNTSSVDDSLTLYGYKKVRIFTLSDYPECDV